MEALSPSQVESIDKFQSISGKEDLDECIACLESAKWDLERAVFRFLDGDSVQETAPVEILSSRDAISTTNIHPLIPTEPISDLEAGQSVIAQIAMPFTWTLQAIWSFLIYTIKLITGLNLLSSQPNPTETARQFHEIYNELYGKTHPKFFAGSYIQALAKAKLEKTFLFIVIHAKSQEFEDFYRNVIGSSQLMAAITESRTITWVGDRDAHDSAGLVRGLGIRIYPFMALAYPEGVKMKILRRFEGVYPIDSIMHELNRTILEVARIRSMQQAEEYTIYFYQGVAEIQEEVFVGHKT